MILLDVPLDKALDDTLSRSRVFLEDDVPVLNEGIRLYEDFAWLRGQDR
jgi:hypothetical protein